MSEDREALLKIVRTLERNEPCCGCCDGESAYDEVRRTVYSHADVPGVAWRVVLRVLGVAERERLERARAAAEAKGESLEPPEGLWTWAGANERANGSHWFRVVIDEDETRRAWASEEPAR